MSRAGIRLVPRGVVLAVSLAVIGCGKAEEKNTPGPPPGGSEEVLAYLPGGAEHAAGKKVYADSGCARCHKLGETGPAAMGGPGGRPGMGGPPGGRPGMGGPDLSHSGAPADHTKEWLAAHIRDPKSHRDRSPMPPSGPDKISDADLDKLASYLASLK